MSCIYLGNLSVEDIQRRAGVTFPPELVEYMKSRQQAVASNIQPGKWHCFDIPFFLVCGDMETATHIYEAIKDLPIKTPFQIGVDNEAAKETKA